MKQNKFCTPSTAFQNQRNHHLMPRRELLSQNIRKHKFSPQKSVSFSWENSSKNKKSQIYELLKNQSPQSIFSMYKNNFQSTNWPIVKNQSSKKPSFNIKKLIEKSYKDKRTVEKKFFENTGENSLFNQYYAREQQDYLTNVRLNQLKVSNENQRLQLIIQRQKNNRSQAKRYIELFDYLQRPPKSKNKTAYFVNNFYRTKLKKNINQQNHQKNDRYTNDPKEIKKMCLKRMELNDNNWMEPWQKNNEFQEDFFD